MIRIRLGDGQWSGPLLVESSLDFAGAVFEATLRGTGMPERYKDEIEEILRQAGELAPARKRRDRGPGIWRLIGLYVRKALGGRLLSISPGRVMVSAVMILVLALIFGRMVPGIGGPLALAALLLFIVGYGWIFVKPPKIEKRWRGQPLDEGTGSWWDRFRWDRFRRKP